MPDTAFSTSSLKRSRGTSPVTTTHRCPLAIEVDVAGTDDVAAETSESGGDGVDNRGLHVSVWFGVEPNSDCAAGHCGDFTVGVEGDVELTNAAVTAGAGDRWNAIDHQRVRRCSFFVAEARVAVVLEKLIATTGDDNIDAVELRNEFLVLGQSLEVADQDDLVDAVGLELCDLGVDE